MKIVKDKISIEKLKDIAVTFYNTMIKGVVDIQREIVVFGGEYHMDANNLLIENGSEQKNIWGFNIHFDKPRHSWIEFTSLINIRPTAGNLDMEVQDKDIRAKIAEIVNSKIL